MSEFSSLNGYDVCDDTARETLGRKAAYASSSTAASTAAKTASTSGGDFTLESGASVIVKFTNGNTASNPTLNVDNTGAKAIYMNGAAIDTDLEENGTYLFAYNGTQFDLVGGVGGGGKLPGSITPASDSVSITGEAGTTQTVSLTVVGDGTLSVSSSNTSVANVSISGQIVTITSVATGNATITVTMADGAAYTGATATISASVLIIPNGSTVTPTDDVQTWLHCAGISDKNYTTLSQVLADSTTLAALIASQNAVNYLVRSTTWSSDACADQTFMSYVGLNNYASNTLLADSDWLNAICGSTYFESVLNVKVPTMTSDTTPEGNCTGTSIRTGKYAYYAFDNNDSTAYQTTSETGSTANVQYQFISGKKILCAYILSQNATRWTSFKLQASNDGTTYIDLTEDITPPVENMSATFVFTKNVNAYNRYRFSGVVSSGQPYVSTLQFYGREDV